MGKVTIQTIEDFKAPSFAEGEDGTLHGGAYKVNGYSFLQIVVNGKPKVKTNKGCSITFQGQGSPFTVQSETRDIESIYSNSLKKGLTNFELFLDDDTLKQLKKGVKSMSITFPKRFGKKSIHTFDVMSGRFKKILS